MKILFSFFITYLFVSISFAQYIETYQPDSIYKKNRVKERRSTYRKVKMGIDFIDKYDKEGRRNESAHTDISHKNITSKTIFEYDKTGKLVNERFYFYYKKNNGIGEYILDPKNPSVSPPFILEYDSLNRIIKKVRTLNNRFKINQVVYTYNPITTKETKWNKDSILIEESTIIYEVANISTRYYRNRDTSLQNKMDFSYKNIFDNSGNLIKRLGGKTDTSCNCLNLNAITSEITYEYNKNGLLIKRTETSYLNNRTATVLQLYTYKFW